MRTSLQAAIGIIMIFILVGSTGLLLGGISGDSDNTETATPTEQVEVETQTDAARQVSTATAIPETESTPVEQNLSERNIESLIESQINNHPDSVTRLSTDTKTAVELDTLAKNHSKDMADSISVSHEVGNGDSEARYRSADLYDKCQFQEQSYIVNAQRNRLEAIARADLNQYRGEDNETTETNIAEVIVEDWYNSITYRDRFQYENAEHLGVGVNISADQKIYATVNIC